MGIRKTTHAYNKKKLGFLSFAASLGGLCMGYNTCIAASALFLIEKQFPETTATIRQVSTYIKSISYLNALVISCS